MSSCDNCKKIFVNKSNLERHLKVSKTCGNTPFICEYCNKSFTSSINLKKHITNTCDKKKEKDNQENIDKKTNEMIEAIRKNYEHKLDEEIQLRNSIIDTHVEKLKEQDEYYDRLIVAETMSKEKIKSEARIKEIMHKEQIDELKKTIESLHERLEKLAASRSVSTVNNVNSNNITLNMFITQEFAKTQATKHLTYDHFANGIRGIATFVHDFILMDKNGKLVYACYDKARHILRYKDDLGNEIDDIDAEKLIAIVGQPIKDKYTKICKELREDILRYQEIIDDEEEGYGMKKEAREKKSKAELSLRVMDMQSGEVCMIGMSKNKKLSREIEKVCLVLK